MSLCKLSVAGIGITLNTQQPLTVTDRFRPFLSEEVKDGYLVEFRETASLPEPDGEPLYRNAFYEVYPDGAESFVRWYIDGMHDDIRFARASTDMTAGRVLVEYLPIGRETVSTIANCYSFSGWETLLLRENRLLLHASCVDTPVGGLLFSGVSGIGKSTQAALWQQYTGAQLINGDRPILEQAQDGWYAWGSPYAGSSHCFVNRSCRIRAIMMLRRAQTCGLRRLKPAEAFRSLFAQITVTAWDKTCMLHACDLTEQLAADIPVYEFSCTPDRTAVDFLYSGLEGQCRIPRETGGTG